MSSNKNECIKRVNKVIEGLEDNYNKTSESLVEVLMTDYRAFLNLGKFIDRIDKNLKWMNDCKNKYKDLMNVLFQQVNDLSGKYNSDMFKIFNNDKDGLIKLNYKDDYRYCIEKNISKNNYDEDEFIHLFKDENFDMNDFLYPKKGSKEWIKEQSEIIQILIKENKLKEASDLLKEIKNAEFHILNYEQRISIDKMYNYLLEKMNNLLIKSNNMVEIDNIINLFKELNHTGMAFDSLLLWITKNLNHNLMKSISFLNENKFDIKTGRVHNESLLESNIDINISESPLKQTKIINLSREFNNLDLDDDNFEKKFVSDVVVNLNSVNLCLKKKRSSIDFRKRDSMIKLDENQYGNQIIYVYEHYFENLEKFLELMEKYFNSDSNQPNDEVNNKSQNEYNLIFYPHLIQWMKFQIKNLADKSEILYLKIKTVEELIMILKYLKKLLLYFDMKQISAKYIFDDCFIYNIKLSLKSIIFHSIKNNNKIFEIGYFNNDNNKNITLEYYCIGEISLITKIIVDFMCYLLDEKLTNKYELIYVPFIEKYFVKTLIYEDYINNLENHLKDLDAYNFKIKAISNKIYDNQKSIPIENEILINYSITLIEINKIFKQIIHEVKEKNIFSKHILNHLLKSNEKIFMFKDNFFERLFKSRLEMHFFHGYAMMLANEKLLDLNLADNILLNNNVSLDLLQDFQKLFYSYFMFVKAMAKNIKKKVNQNNKIFSYLISDIFFFKNFLFVMSQLKDLNIDYNIEFSFQDIDSNGFLTIILGIYFVYNLIHVCFEIEEEARKLQELENFIDSIINDFYIIKNIEVNTLHDQKKILMENSKYYVIKNKEILKKDF